MNLAYQDAGAGSIVHNAALISYQAANADLKKIQDSKRALEQPQAKPIATAAPAQSAAALTAVGSAGALDALKGSEKTQQLKVSQLHTAIFAAVEKHGQGSIEHTTAPGSYRAASAELKRIQDQIRTLQNPQAATAAAAGNDGNKHRMDAARAAGDAIAAAGGTGLAFQAAKPVAGAEKPAAVPEQGVAGELATLRRIEAQALVEEKAIVEKTSVMLQKVKAVLDQNQGGFPGLHKVELILDRDEEANQDTYPTLSFSFKNEKEAAEMFKLFGDAGAEPASNAGSKTSFKLKPALRTKLTDYRNFKLGITTDENERERIKNTVLVPAREQKNPGMSAYSLLMALPSLTNRLDVASVRETKIKLAAKLEKLTAITPVKDAFTAEQFQEQGVNDGSIPLWNDQQIDAQLPEVLAIYYMTGAHLMEHLEQNLKLGVDAPKPMK